MIINPIQLPCFIMQKKSYQINHCDAKILYLLKKMTKFTAFIHLETVIQKNTIEMILLASTLRRNLIIFSYFTDDAY